MFKRSDYYILSIICFFLGIFVMTQYYSVKEYQRVIQPQNNEVIALEVAKLTGTNADLRAEVQKLTSDLDTYNDSTQSSKSAYEKFVADSERLDLINGIASKKGQGVTIEINGQMNLAQLVDLTNAVKNIGAELISINGRRIVINSELSSLSGLFNYEFNMIGNSELLKSALERRGGIIEQIATNDLTISITKNDQVEIPTTNMVYLNHAKIVSED